MKVVLFTQSSKSTYSVPIKLVLYKVTGLKKEIFSFDRFSCAMLCYVLLCCAMLCHRRPKLTI